MFFICIHNIYNQGGELFFLSIYKAVEDLPFGKVKVGSHFLLCHVIFTFQNAFELMAIYKIMKKTLFACCLFAITLISCGPKEQVWEYKVVKVAGKDAERKADYGSLVYGDQTSMLNKMGKDGWELVDIYTEVATAFPNFGNSKYVTGIRENVRTSVVNFVFKRISKNQEEHIPAKVEPRKDITEL